MKFIVEQPNEFPNPIFTDEPSPRNWLLSTMLYEIRTSAEVQDFLDEIRKARSGEKLPSGYTCDGVDVEFYQDRAVIEELYPAAGEDAEPEKAEITLDEAERVLLEWRSVLERWWAQHPQLQHS